ncbi:MAG: hypothetical protein AB7O24_17370 [Kofleriaceae bacterium]
MFRPSAYLASCVVSCLVACATSDPGDVAGNGDPDCTDDSKCDNASLPFKVRVERRLAADRRERDLLLQLVKDGKIDQIPSNPPVNAEDGTQRLKALHAANDDAVEDNGLDAVAQQERFTFDFNSPVTTNAYLEDYLELDEDGAVSYPAFVGVGDFVVSEQREEGSLVYSVSLSGDNEPLQFKVFYAAPLKERLAHYYPQTDSEAAYLAAFNQAKAETNERFPELHQVIAKLKAAGFPLVEFSVQDYEGSQNAQIEAVVFALKRGRSSRQLLTYVEGGDLLVGTKSDGGRYALIGRDAVTMTQVHLSEQIGRALSRNEAITLIGKDYGIDPANILEIDQPGDFHIDMYMSLAPNRKVVLNDALAAYNLQIMLAQADLEENPDGVADLEQFAKPITEFRAQFEEPISTQLVAAGFEVARVPGVFYWNTDAEGLSEKQRANYLNTEKAIGSDGTSYAILLDGSPGAEDTPAGELAKQNTIEAVRQAFGVDRMHLIQDNGFFLEGDGAVACLFKGEYVR